MRRLAPDTYYPIAWLKTKRARRNRTIGVGAGRRTTSVTKHYLDHKEAARGLIHARLEHFNNHYGLSYKRVAIRNQRRSWGSCTSLGNLNFSYKILFLPPDLADYIIVHELCHLKELNHKERFWNLVAEIIPDYSAKRQTLKKYDHLHPFKLALLARQRIAENFEPVEM
ncbi:MAG: M48 family metallopeptidase [Candidatus Paceibacterota bacterium]